MDEAKRVERLDELNKKCMECQERARKRFETINPVECGQFCETGREIHKLENGEWDKVDWNSAKFESLYRH